MRFAHLGRSEGWRAQRNCLSWGLELSAFFHRTRAYYRSLNSVFGAHCVVVYQVKLALAALPSITKEIARHPRHATAFNTLLNRLVFALSSSLFLVLPRHVLGALAVVQSNDIVAEGTQQQHIVAEAAAGNQGRSSDDGAGGVAERVAAGVALEGRRDEVGALGEQVGEGQGRAGAVPGVEGLLVEGVPGVVVFGDGLGGEGLAEFGGRVHCRCVCDLCWDFD